MLRPYQVEIINACHAHMAAGRRSILVQSPTGSGKTLLTAHMLRQAAGKGLSSWFVVHRRELVKQSLDAFKAAGVHAGVVAAGWPEDPRRLVQVAGAQTLAQRLARVRRPRLIVWDEAHHLAAGTWSQIFASYEDAYHIGLTATPERLDGQGLRPYFGVMVEGPSVAWLIQNGYLSRFRYFAPGGISTEGIPRRGGDFAREALAEAADRPTITGDMVSHYLRLARGKRAVVFAASVAHSQHIVEAFLGAGIRAEHVDAKTDPDVRDAAMARFRAGTTEVLSNVDLFGEGVDVPAIDVAILGRPTQSLTLFLQQVGRALRVYPGKDEALILDHAGNVERHGLPDQVRAWSLDGKGARIRSEGDSGPGVRVCPACFAALPGGTPKCPCGHVFVVKVRKLEQVDGELHEIEAAAFRARQRQVQGRAKTFDELVAIGRARGYGRPYLWARHILMGRARSGRR